MMQIKIVFSVSFFCLVLTLAFQNCSPVSLGTSTSASVAQDPATASGDDGSGVKDPVEVLPGIVATPLTGLGTTGCPVEAYPQIVDASQIDIANTGARFTCVAQMKKMVDSAGKPQLNIVGVVLDANEYKSISVTMATDNPSVSSTDVSKGIAAGLALTQIYPGVNSSFPRNVLSVSISVSDFKLAGFGKFINARFYSMPLAGWLDSNVVTHAPEPSWLN